MPDVTSPRLVWIKSIYNEDEDYYESDFDEIAAALGIESTDSLKKNTEHVDSDEKFIRIWRHNTAGLMGMDYNSIIGEIDEDCNWRGPVLIQTGIAGDLLEPLEMRNIVAADVRNIATFCEQVGRSLG